MFYTSNLNIRLSTKIVNNISIDKFKKYCGNLDMFFVYDKFSMGENQNLLF